MIVPFQGFLGQQNKTSNLGGDPRYFEILDNCNVTYRTGEITKDVGYAQFGNSVIETNMSPTGFFDFHQSPTMQRALVTINNAAGTNLQLLYHDSPYATAGAWTAISIGTTWNAFEDSAVEMESFLGYCFFVGYDSTDDAFLPVATLTGTTFSTTDGTTDMPQGKFIKRYRDRIYLLNTRTGGTNYPYRVYFTNAGVRTWDLTNNFVDFDYGSEITGGGVVGDLLLAFTPYQCWFYNQVQRKVLFNQGCVAHRTIKNYAQALFFANTEGVWITKGGEPTLISQDVRNFIKASTNPAGWFAEINQDEYWLYIGSTVTVRTDGESFSYSNCVLIYNINENTWRVRELGHIPTIFMGSYNRTTGIQSMHIGATNGYAYTVSLPDASSPTYSYAGSDISALFRTRPLDLGDQVNEKIVEKIYGYAGRAQGLKLKGRWIAKNRKSRWFDIGEMNNQFEEFNLPPDDKSGLFLQIEGLERSQRTSFSFKGFNIRTNLETNKV